MGKDKDAVAIDNFEVLGLSIDIMPGDLLEKETNEFNEEGKLYKNYTSRKDIILETTHYFNDNGLVSKVVTDIQPKIKMITPKRMQKVQPIKIESVSTEIEYDEEGRITVMSANGLMTDHFSYTKTGKTTHTEYSDLNNGIQTIVTVTDKNGNVIKRTVKINDAVVYSYNKTLFRSMHVEKEKQINPFNGNKRELLIHYIIIDGKRIVYKYKETESCPGYRYIKELVQNSYNDNHDIEYERYSELVNGNETFEIKKYNYRNGKLVSIVDENGIELEYYTKKKGYNVSRVLPQNITSILHRLYIFEISKSTKTANYLCKGSLNGTTYIIDHSNSKDEFYLSKTTNNQNDIEAIKLHIIKDNIVFDLEYSIEKENCEVSVQYLNNKGKVENKIRYNSKDNTHFNEIYEKLIESKIKEINKFEQDIASIIS